MTLTDVQRELLEDKFLVWERASRVGPPDLLDYNRRAAEALKAALALASSAEAATDELTRLRAIESAVRKARGDGAFSLANPMLEALREALALKPAGGAEDVT